MEIKVLDENFQPARVIDDFLSVVWTERYRGSGDVTLTVNPTDIMKEVLVEGIFLQTEGSQEVMLIETVLNEDGVLKVSGNTLDNFLKDRVVRFSWNHLDRYYTYTATPGAMMAQLIATFTVDGGYIPGQAIPTLSSSGDIYVDDPEVTFAIPYGPLYDAVNQLAETYDLGWSVYLDSIDPETDDFHLEYRIYKGRDLTSEQEENAVVQFSPSMDTLTNVKKLRSISGYKNVAYAYCTSDLEILAVDAAPVVAYANVAAETATGFDRRILMVLVDDITTDKVEGSLDTLLDILEQRAKDALANNNFTRVLDGQVVPQNRYTYGVDYILGDIVELSDDGMKQRARITEYIRSQDKEGERAYPTVSVLE